MTNRLHRICTATPGHPPRDVRPRTFKQRRKNETGKKEWGKEKKKKYNCKIRGGDVVKGK
jgi:hypothetical protein